MRVNESLLQSLLQGFVDDVSVFPTQSVIIELHPTIRAFVSLKKIFPSERGFEKEHQRLSVVMERQYCYFLKDNPVRWSLEALYVDYVVYHWEVHLPYCKRSPDSSPDSPPESSPDTSPDTSCQKDMNSSPESLPDSSLIHKIHCADVGNDVGFIPKIRWYNTYWNFFFRRVFLARTNLLQSKKGFYTIRKIKNSIDVQSKYPSFIKSRAYESSDYNSKGNSKGRVDLVDTISESLTELIPLPVRYSCEFQPAVQKQRALRDVAA